MTMMVSHCLSILLRRFLRLLLQSRRSNSYCGKLRRIIVTRRRTNDEIHSSIQLGPVLTCILDTPPMQRLRGLKQLGTAEYVYVNVNHNRFEHSLGVAALAETLCQKIRCNQPSLHCTAKDVLCVQLAGLLHDIGHGPFSHAYEDFVRVQHPQYLARQSLAVQQAYRDAWPALPRTWTHETASLLMIDAVLAHLGLAIDLQRLDAPLRQIGDGVAATSMRVFADDNCNNSSSCSSRAPKPDKNKNGADDSSSSHDDGVLTSRDFVFVKECIWGTPIPALEAVLGPGFHGRRGVHQDWLYDIVSNRHSGLDVDKVDYYARDQRRALRESGEIDKVLIAEAVVAWADCTDPTSCHRCRRPAHNSNNKHAGAGPGNGKHLMICYPKKLIGASMDFFKTRFTLHSKIYRHKTIEAVSFMIADILCLADPHFRIPIAPLTGGDGDPHHPNHVGGASTTTTSTTTTNCDRYDALPPSRAMLHPGSYVRLRDAVIDQIAATTGPELDAARRLIYRLWSRDLYKCVATKVLRRHTRSADRRLWDKPADEIVREILGYGGTHDVAAAAAGDGRGRGTANIIALKEDDIIVQKCEIHHGQKDQDPLTKMRFLEKDQLHKISGADYRDLPVASQVDEDDYNAQLPRALMECSLRVYCKESAKASLLSHLFSLWWQEIHAELELTAAGNEGEKAVTQDTDDDDDGADLVDNGLDRRSSYPPWCSPN
jgi:hypothetical protein